MDDDGWGDGFGTDAVDYPTLTGVQPIKSNKLEHLLAAPMHLQVHKRKHKTSSSSAATSVYDAPSTVQTEDAAPAEAQPVRLAKNTPDLSGFVLHPAAARPRVRFADPEDDTPSQPASKKAKRGTAASEGPKVSISNHVQSKEAKGKKPQQSSQQLQQDGSGSKQQQQQQQQQKGSKNAGQQQVPSAGSKADKALTQANGHAATAGANAGDLLHREGSSMKRKHAHEALQQVQHQTEQQGQKLSKKQKVSAALQGAQGLHQEDAAGRQQPPKEAKAKPHSNGVGLSALHIKQGGDIAVGMGQSAQRSKQGADKKAGRQQGLSENAVQKQTDVQHGQAGGETEGKQASGSSAAVADMDIKAAKKSGSHTKGAPVHQSAARAGKEGNASGSEARAGAHGNASGSEAAESGDDKQTPGAVERGKGAGKSQLLDSMRARLAGARFRSLNEQLYTCNGDAAYQMMQDDPTLFKQYHEGFQSQTEGWPQQPLEVAAKWLSSRPADLVVVDFGCGEGRLATIVKQKVHSFDLVSAAPHVVACNMASVPLDTASADVAVFSLALMGVDYGSFLVEAARVLRHKGWLWIAEVKSRFTKQESKDSKEDLKPFLNCLAKLGFQLVSLDIKNTMFFTAVLRKANTPSGSPDSLPWPPLKACVYKKR